MGNKGSKQFEEIAVNGDIPPPRGKHTVTRISDTIVIVFGG